MISQATPPFFIFSLLKRQMDKVYCKVGSALGKTVQDERGETSAGERERKRDEIRTKVGIGRERAREEKSYAVGEAAGSVSSYNY